MTGGRSLAELVPGGEDTIVALATAPGRGAISIVRLSGPDAFRIASALVDPWPLQPRRSTLCRISDGDQQSVVDRALVTVYVAPETFTGEDLVEISGHGGHYVPAMLIETLIAAGARQALPGEFSRRAVLNGKLDIVQAEAIGDIVDARSKAMHRAAMGQLDGGLSRRIAALRSKVIEIESLIAYDIDFPEEDDGPIPRQRISDEIRNLVSSLDDLLRTVPAGEMIREGAIVVIAGRPNVGKSSLFNALLGQSRAIVTDIPGTTRDAIESMIETNNWPLRIVDTAGLRQTSDTIELMGIEVSERYLGAAHVVLACGDSEESLSATCAAVQQNSDAPILRVRTKCDLDSGPFHSPDWFDVSVSAETGDGLSHLLDRIDEALSATIGSIVADVPLLTRTRHIHGITMSRNEIEAFGQAWTEGWIPAPVAAVHLRAAATALEDLIGAVSTEDVLDRVFSSFCIGK